MKVGSPEAVISWLASQGAHPWLVQHHRLVLETGILVVDGLRRLFGDEALNDEMRQRVLIGCSLHDAGKVLHPAEMNRSGTAHEEAGQEWLIRCGFPESLARFCVTHAAWHRAEFEDCLVALADKLW